MKQALIVVDVQCSLVEEGIFQAKEVIGRLNQLIAHTRAQNQEVIFIQDTRVEPNMAIHPDLARNATDLIIHKDVRNSFENPFLLKKLEENGIEELIIGGMQSNYCVQETCKGAIEHGYRVLIPEDAHSTLDEGEKKAKDFIKAQNLAWSSQSGNIKVMATEKIIK